MLNDTLRIMAIDKLAWEKLNTDTDSTLLLAKIEMEMAEDIKSKKWKSEALNTMATAYYIKGDYSQSLELHRKNLILKKELKDERGYAIVCVNISNIYSTKGDYPLGLEYLQKGLPTFEKLKDKKSISRIMNNIGLVYVNMKDYSKALSCFRLCIALYTESGNEQPLGNVYNNMGIVYKEIGIPDSAQLYYEKALAVYENYGDKRRIAAAYGNIGSSLEKMNRVEEAKSYFLKSIELRIPLKDEVGLAQNYANLGIAERRLRNYQSSLEHCLKGLELSEKVQIMESERANCECLYLTYKEMGDMNNALLYYEKTVAITDSLFSDEKTRDVARKESKFEYDKKEMALQEEIKRKQLLFEFERKQAILLAENEKKEAEFQAEMKRKQLAFEYEKKQAEEKVLNEKKEMAFREDINRREIENESQRKLIFLFVGAFAVMSVLAVFIYRGYRYKQRAHTIISRQKQETEEQKLIIEDKQKEIIDSITYAKRLQQAILAPPEEISRYFQQNFLLYKPKDIVAGDFYFFEFTGSHIFYAAADCTGHGVPGAMVSIVCSNALSRCVKEFGLTDPAEILNKTRDIVLETFKKSNETVYDGMDISLIAIDKNNKQVKWAGANNPLWIFINENKSIAEIQPDKQPVGFSFEPTPFVSHEIKVEKNDIIYLFTDGYADQFGGPKAKKFKYSSLNKLLCEVSSLGMEEQKNKLEKSFAEWKGALEQVDDVCIIGVKI